MQITAQTNRRPWILFILLVLFSCTQEISDTGFLDEEDLLFSIATYIEENQADYERFWKMIEVTGSFDALNAYNPGGEGFTFFLPTDEAVDNFLAQSEEYPNFETLLQDPGFCMQLIQYHLVNKSIRSTELPYGVLPDSTVSGDYLTISIEVTEDTSIYKVNSLAAILERNIEVSNGYIHVVDHMLEPIIFSSYEWLLNNPQFSIMASLFDATGLKDTMGVYRRSPTGALVENTYTLLAEPDSIYSRAGIMDLDDLNERFGTPGMEPDNPDNGLYQFAAYHILEGVYFLDAMDGSRNYNTYALAPVAINSGYDIKINTGADTFQIISSATDTAYIDYILPLYEHSNINTKTGAIHAIDEVMEFYVPQISDNYFQFFEEPEILAARLVPGTYEYVDKDLFQYLTWEGPDEIVYYKSASTEEKASNKDYIFIKGDFTIDYVVPKVLPGIYQMRLQAEATYAENATIEVFLDGKKMGSNFNLTSGGSATWPYYNIKVGIVEFTRYEEHTVSIQTLIPGEFKWDFIGFIPN